MMNFKQEKLMRDFYKAMKKEFPEVDFISVTESPEDPYKQDELKWKTRNR